MFSVYGILGSMGNSPNLFTQGLELFFNAEMVGEPWMSEHFWPLFCQVTETLDPKPLNPKPSILQAEPSVVSGFRAISGPYRIE